LNHEGGGEKIIPPFVKPKNAPFKSNTEKQISKAKYEETQFAQPPLTNIPPRQDQKPIVDLQVYEAMKKPVRKPDPSLYMPVVTMNPNQLPFYQGYGLYEGQLIYPNIPVIKKYNINIDGPFADHTKVNQIFEDFLPEDQFKGTFDNISDRVNFYNYFKSRVLNKGDGEIMKLADCRIGETRSLLSFIKFVELNPYNPELYSLNPMKGLPKGFLIYSACYPVRYDKQNGIVKCAKNSVGLNIRLYELSEDEYLAKYDRDKKPFDEYKYNIWREIFYYEYVREKILKENICPNFVMLDAWALVPDSGVNFSGITKANDKQALHDALQAAMQQMNEPPPVAYNKLKDYYEKEKQNNPLLTTKNVVVAITEACTDNIIGWGIQKHSGDGTVKEMINIGYHKDQFWFSVLFQLAYALAVMQKHVFMFNNFDLAKNVYIKDIKYDAQGAKHWRYKLDDFTYYVPNYGYLVMIDSRYTDVNPGEYKIYGKMFTDNGKCVDDIKKTIPVDSKNRSEDDIKKMVFDAFKKSFMTSNFQQDGMSKPSDKVIEFIGKIESSINDNDVKDQTGKPSTDITDYIKKYFYIFANNRIGDALSSKETGNVRTDMPLKLDGKEGTILSRLTQNGGYEFVQYVSRKDGQIANILTKINNEIKPKEVRIDELFNYEGDIKQTFTTASPNLTTSGLLDTYFLK